MARAKAAEPTPRSECVQYVALTTLRPNPLNPRSEVGTDPEMAELVASIASSGLLQPLLVTPDYLIVAGHRRAVACRLAGLAEVPVFIRDLDERAQLEAMLAENIARRSLNPLEIAKACKALQERGRSIEQIAGIVGIGKMTADKHLAILKLPEDLQQMVGNYSMPLGYVPHLAQLKSEAEMQRIGRLAVSKNWMVYEVSAAVANSLRPLRPETKAAVQAPAPQHVPTRPIATAPKRVDPVVAAKDHATVGTGVVLDLLTELCRMLDKHRHLFADAAVRSAVGRFAKLWNGGTPR